MTRCAAILTAVLIPSAAFAQGTAQSWPGLAKVESTVHVLDDTGVEATGKLLRFDPDSLVLLVGDTERRFEAARVRRIEKRGDSLRNGAIIGAVVGAAFALLGTRMGDCPGDNPSGPCPGFRAATVLLSIGIGTGIDALVVGRTTWYEAPAAPGRSALMPHGRRVALSWGIRW